MRKRLFLVFGAAILAAAAWFGWDRWQQTQVEGSSDTDLSARKSDPRAIKERIKRAETREDPASGAAAWVELSVAQPNDPVPLLRASLAWEAAAQPTNAYSVLNQAYKKWPQDLRVLKSRAGFFERQGDRAQAVKTFHEWLKLEPGSVNGHLRLADALYAAGVLEDAADHYRAALKRDPKLDGPRRRVALVSLLQGSTEAAEEEVATLLKKAQAEGISYQLRAEIALASRGLAAKTAAADDLQLALVRSPELTSSLFLLGLLKESEGDLKGAVTDYQRLLSRDPYHRAGSYRLARLAQRLGRSKDAEALQLRHRALAKAQGDVERYTAALSASPGDLALNLQLARAFRTLGRLQDAMSAYSQVLRSRPNDAALQREVQPLLRQMTPPQGAAGGQPS